MAFKDLVYFLFVVLLSMKGVQNDGTISVKLNRFENKEGIGENGHCCDGKWNFCISNGCDHQFTICLDTDESDDDVHGCIYGKKKTDDTTNMNTINFGNRIGSTANPMRFRVPGAMPTSFSLKVDVTDADWGSKDEQVDFLRLDIMTSSNRMDRNFVLQRRTWLEVQISTECVVNYYGRKCEFLCPPPGESDHYRCDGITGEKICLQGWTGPNCQVAPCDNFECENGGKCDVTPHGRPLCICHEDYTGPHCETRKCDLICLPGDCILVEGQKFKFICRCQDQDGNVINGDGKACEFPVVEPSTVSPPTTPEPKWNHDCSSIVRHPEYGPGSRGRNGIYTIHPPGGQEFPVYCHMTSSAEGWTVIQRRHNGGEDFFRGWEDYKDGFGKAGEDGEFWLGLEKMHRLTSSQGYKLRVDIIDYFGDIKYADYEKFYVDGEMGHYRLHVNGYSGDAGDSLSMTEDDNITVRHHDGMPFSTYDRDLDFSIKYNCAQLFQSGWWFSSCFRSNLNGVYRHPTGDARCCAFKDRCVTWQTIDRMSLRQVEMKIIPNN